LELPEGVTDVSQATVPTGVMRNGEPYGIIILGKKGDEQTVHPAGHQEGVKPSRHMVLVSRLAVVPLGVEWDLRLGSAQLQSDVRQMEVL